MRTLKAEIRKNGYTYRLLERNEHAAIYSQSNDERVVAYEVGRIKIVPEGMIDGNLIEGGEAFWGNEDIGRIAWSISDRGEAMKRFNEIQQKDQ